MDEVMSTDRITFSHTDMQEYINNFDGICMKYDLSPAKAAKRYKIYDRLQEHEALACPHMKHRDYAITLDDLKIIYQTNSEARSMLELYKSTLDRVVNGFIDIEGIDRLFPEKYFDYEWDMHTRLVANEGHTDFYRDHFIHQMRVFYEMMCLLDDLPDGKRSPFTEEAIHNFLDDGIGIVYDEIHRSIHKTCENMTLREKRLYYRLLQDNDSYDDLDNCYPDEKTLDDALKENRKLETNLFLYFLRLSCTLCGLFHDIGYPIKHSITQSQHLTEYISLLYSSDDTATNFERISSLLENSLLYKIVKREEIKSRLNDHGTLSALTFLLHFYENGSIARVTPIQAAAIEVAAVAIYDHHMDYSIYDPKNKDRSPYYQPHFYGNPVGFLLRLCDDIQEWDRRYFDYRYSSALRICPICMTPVVGLRTFDKDMEFAELEDGDEHYHSVCLCGRDSHKSPDEKIYRNCYHLVPVDMSSRALKYQPSLSQYGTGVHAQKITVVQTCQKMTLEPVNNPGKISFELFSLKYEPYRILQMCCIAPDFAKYRAKDLAKLKKTTESQFLDFRVGLDYFMTTNPLLLKCRILWDYLKYTGDFTDPVPTENNQMNKDDQVKWAKIRMKIDKYIKKDVYTFPNAVKAKNFTKLKNSLITHIQENAHLYLSLLKYYFEVVNNPGNSDSVWESNLVETNLFKSEPLSMLLEDAKTQLTRLAKTWRYLHLSETNYRVDYEKLFIAEYDSKEFKAYDKDYYYAMVEAYCSTEILPHDWSLPDKAAEGDKHYPDFYSDLLLYKKLAEAVYVKSK